MIRKVTNTLFYVVIPIIAGGLIYISWGESTLLVFDWIEAINFDMVFAYRDHIEGSQEHLPNFLIYNIPDGLWVFAVTNSMLIIWDAEIRDNNLLWVLSGLLLAVPAELGQIAFLSLVPGTFDVLDLLIYFIGFLSSLSLFSPDYEGLTNEILHEAYHFIRSFEYISSIGIR